MMSEEIDGGLPAGSLESKDTITDNPVVAADQSKNDINTIRDRLRNDGLQTVSKLLQESRAENKILKDKNNQLERTVDTLNSKLQKSAGGGAGPTSNGDSRATSTHIDDEISLPASSKHLVENLIRENNRLKHQLQNPQKLDEISMQACNLQSLNNSLKQEKGKLEQELSSLKSVIHLGEAAKDKHIVSLLDELNESNQNFQRERNHRLTLEAEIGKLNDELTDTAQKCLNMRKQLPSTPSTAQVPSGDRVDSITALPDSLGTSTAAQGLSERSVYEQNTRLEAKCAQLEQQVQSLQKLSANSRGTEQLLAENSRLKERLSEREEEIDKLREQCALLKHQLEIYHEDFKKERTDRELTNRRYSKMEEEYRNLAMQVPAKSSTGNNAWDGRQQAASRPRTGQTSVRFSSQSSSKPVIKDNQRKAATTKSSIKNSASLSLECDNDSLSSQTELVRPSQSSKRKADLACYKCDKRFGVDHHSELIDHLDVCTGPK